MTTFDAGAARAPPHWASRRPSGSPSVAGSSDFLATIYHHIGIDYGKTFIKDFNGRPTAIVDHGKAIPELSA